MSKLSTSLRILSRGIGIGLLILTFTVVLKLTRPAQPVQPAAETIAVPTPSPETTPLPSATPFETGYAYPPPNPELYLPSKVHSLLDYKAYLEGVDALVLDDQRAWIVTQEGARQVGEFNDVAVLYGWNFDGSKILIGRGLYDTMGELAKSTELWVYDLTTEKAHRLVDSTRIWSAAWSPVEDLIAYCEWGEIPTLSIVNPEGEIAYKRSEYFYSDIAWSPDGSAIAVIYSIPDKLDSDVRYSVLSIWWLSTNEIQPLLDVKRESHYFPVWSSDGGNIVFTRLLDQENENNPSGLYTIDINTSQVSYVENGPRYIVNRIFRSPRSNTYVFWMGDEVYEFQIGKPPILLGKGEMPIWHLDGKTIFYSEGNKYHSSISESISGNQLIGGGFSASTIHLQPDLFFQESKSK